MSEMIELSSDAELRAADAHSIITSFTPSIMGEAMLRDIFVARQPLVDRLVRNIRDATTSEARRHALLVGPRGIGKTHLVSMVYYAIKDDLALTDNLRIAWLREEEWSIFSWADLLVQVFRALANEYSDDRQHLTEIADHLRRVPIDEGAVLGEAQLLEFLGGRLLLIIAENVNDIFEGMGEQGQQSLRAFLQNHSRALLLTTAPALSADLSEHDAPFYGFFNTTHLQELTRAEARELLINIAELDGPNTELVNYLKTDKADRRLRVIETLAGGHPRIWILFSACMSQKLLDELVPLFIKMLDDLTPYYQERMRSLPPQERRLISFLCEQRGAVPVKKIAEACRLKPNAAAAMLGKLEAKAFVRKAAEPIVPSTGDRRVSFYEMGEPLMRLCIEVKTSRAQPLGLIVEFLRLWFDEEDIVERLSALPAYSDLSAEYLSAVLRRIAALRKEMFPLIHDATVHYTSGKPDLVLDDIKKILAVDPQNSTAWMLCALALIAKKRLTEALQSLERAEEVPEDIAFISRVKGDVLGELGKYGAAVDAYASAIQYDPSELFSYLGLFDVLLRQRQFVDAMPPLRLLLQAPENENYSYEHLAMRVTAALLLPADRPDLWEEMSTEIVKIFANTQTISALATGLTVSIRALFDRRTSNEIAAAWLAVWEKASDGIAEMGTALRVMRGAVEWKRTRDRGAILQLAAEERAVLESLLPKGQDIEVRLERTIPRP